MHKPNNCFKFGNKNAIISGSRSSSLLCGNNQLISERVTNFTMMKVICKSWQFFEIGGKANSDTLRTIPI